MVKILFNFQYKMRPSMIVSVFTDSGNRMETSITRKTLNNAKYP